MSTSSDELTSLEKFSRQRMRSSFIDKEDLIDGRNPKHDEKPMVGVGHGPCPWIDLRYSVEAGPLRPS